MNTQDLIRQWEGMSARDRDVECAVIDGWPRNKTRYDTGAACVPPYTSPDSPRSLLDGLEAKTREMVGEEAWILALFAAVRGKVVLDFGGLSHSAALAAATAEQRGFACYLAVKGRSEGE